MIGFVLSIFLDPSFNVLLHFLFSIFAQVTGRWAVGWTRSGLIVNYFVSPLLSYLYAPGRAVKSR